MQVAERRAAFRYLVTAVLLDRVAYHGVLALLIFYLADGKGLSTAESSAIFGALGALVYAATPIGATVSDQWLGQRTSTLSGAWLLFVGLVCIAMDASGQVPAIGNALLYGGLGFMVVGLGATQPSVANMVGALSGETDTERDAAYSVFWMVMNIGVLIGPLLCGWLGQAIGWGVGFGACVIAMALSLVFFHLSAHTVPSLGLPAHPERLARRTRSGLRAVHGIAVGALLGVIAAQYLLRHTAFVGTVLAVIFVGAIGGYLYFAVWRCNDEERSRALTCLVITVFSFAFLILLNQYGTALAFFTAEHIDLRFLGVTWEPSQVVSFQPAFLVLVMPAILAAWTTLARRGRPVSPLTKMAWGLGSLGLAFGWLALGARFGGEHGDLHMGWMISFYAVMAISEILVAPIGLSFTAKLAVPRIAGFTVGIWMLAWSAASYIAGVGGGWVSTSPAGATVAQSLARYAFYFGVLATAGVLIALILWTVSPGLQRRVHAAFAAPAAPK